MRACSLMSASVCVAAAAVVCMYMMHAAGWMHRERSLTIQIIKYFSRAHDSIPSTDISSNAAWYGPDLQSMRDEWQHIFSADEIYALKRAVKYALDMNKPLNQLKKSDFPLDALEANVSLWRQALDPKSGLGVVVLKGAPVKGWTEREQEVFWWGLGLHLGIPGAQNGKGELLGRVTNEFYGKSDAHVGSVRQYRTSEDIGFHCDGADVVGLLCLQSAGVAGGRSRLASSVTIFNELRRQRPDLIPLLFERVPLDSRGDAGVNWIFVTPCAYFNNILKTFWHTEYFQTAYKYPDTPSLSPAMLELIQVYDAIANDPAVYTEMDFEEGDIQLISNHVVSNTCCCSVEIIAL